jgi:hypothetical protein
MTSLPGMFSSDSPLAHRTILRSIIAATVLDSRIMWGLTCLLSARALYLQMKKWGFSGKANKINEDADFVEKSAGYGRTTSRPRTCWRPSRTRGLSAESETSVVSVRKTDGSFVRNSQLQSRGRKQFELPVKHQINKMLPARTILRSRTLLMVLMLWIHKPTAYLFRMSIACYQTMPI